MTENTVQFPNDVLSKREGVSDGTSEHPYMFLLGGGIFDSFMMAMTYFNAVGVPVFVQSGTKGVVLEIRPQEQLAIVMGKENAVQSISFFWEMVLSLLDYRMEYRILDP